MTAPLSNKADPADEGEEIARTLYGVCAADRYVPPGAFSAGIVTDTILLHPARGGRFSAFAGQSSEGHPHSVPCSRITRHLDPVNAGHAVPAARVTRAGPRFPRNGLLQRPTRCYEGMLEI